MIRDDGAHVIALLRAKPGEERAAAREAAGLIAPSRAEPENLAYAAFQVVNDPSHIVFVERWTDMAAFERHLTRDHMVTFLAQADHLFTGLPEILFLNEICR